MDTLEVKRVAIVDAGAFGVMLHDSLPFAVTLERTYPVGGGQHIKIGPGLYRCTKTTYYGGGYPTFEIHVPGHSRILFHKGNWESDLDGCIAVGESYEILNGKPAIAQSGKGFKEFMQKMGHLEYFDLRIS